MDLDRNQELQAINKLLLLDSLYHIICWDDRISLHELRIKPQSKLNPHLAQKLQEVACLRWRMPELRYQAQGLLTYFCQDTTEWLPMAQYYETYQNPFINY
jgi:hypothetical protein